MISLIKDTGFFQRWVGLSSDTKPTSGVRNGAELVEMNTGKAYRFNAETHGWIDSTADYPVSIAIKTSPDKTEYTVGESFDPTGLVCTVTYQNGDTADIVNTSKFVYEPGMDAELTENVNKITVYYTENGVKCYTEQDITVSAASGDDT